MNVPNLVFIEFIGLIVTLVLFIDLTIQTPLKRILNLGEEYKKPYDCFRCSFFWYTQATLLTFILISFNDVPEAIKLLLYGTGVNYIVSFLTDKIVN